MKNKKFELAKPMNMVQMMWPSGMTPSQIKVIHSMTMQLKKWIMDTKFKPNEKFGIGLDSYQGIKTSFEMDISEFATLIGSTKKSLIAQCKDEDGNAIMFKKFPKLRIMDHFDEIQNIKCKINSQYITGSFYPLPSALYDKKTGTVRLGTTFEMAVILQDEAFSKNLSFVDMQLQLSLNSVMAMHILDRISRFKTHNNDYKCTVGDLIDQCGIDKESTKNRSDFIKVNIKRPLKQIITKSNGVWELVGSGVTVTAKKRGTLLREDEIVFKVKYNDPDKKLNPNSLKEQLTKARINAFEGHKIIIDMVISGICMMETDSIKPEELHEMMINISMLNFSLEDDLVIDEETQKLIDKNR